MNHIDNLLAQMRDMPLDPHLDAIDDAVLDGLAEAKRTRVSTSAMATVGALSLAIGMLGSLAPAQPVRAASVFPLGAPATLAPSTLLGGR